MIQTMLFTNCNFGNSCDLLILSFSIARCTK
ncbi:hypothetical protein NC653_000697 [Populus alba x Populus x berolinensis]|uniref:Uncharacterized protein n=1 Tax=Populus alba x Populus x berolinensis TaxID=444605 RepID=A0AAD6RJ83_9ROSI|nr:hypothetical protein NC653_000697 [Populus alba x Populus x berolinensis]